MKRFVGAIGVLLAAALTAGCGSDGGSARAVERILPRLVGQADRYELQASDVSGSRLGKARVLVNRLRADERLVLDQARLDLRDLRYDRSRRELVSVARADFSAVLLQEDLNAVLRDRPSIVRGLRLSITPERAQLRGSADIPGVRLPITPEFTLDGRLKIDDQGRLSFDAEGIRVVGIEVAPVAAKLLATQINPLVDLNNARLPVYLQTMELGSGEVRIAGRARVRTGSYADLESQ